MKIIFTLIDMNLGGTEKAFLSQLEQILNDGHEITVQLLHNRGKLLPYLSPEVTVIELKEYKEWEYFLNLPTPVLFKKYLKELKFLNLVTLIRCYMSLKFSGIRASYFKHVSNACTLDTNEYDVAVAYAGPMDFITHHVLNNIAAKRKIQWIHFDLDMLNINEKYLNKVLPEFDAIGCINSKIIDQVNSISNNKAKPILFPNVIDVAGIQKLACLEKPKELNNITFTIVTVARLTSEKGIDIALLSLKYLIDKGFNINWYFIGDGNMMSIYLELINKLCLTNNAFLLGSKLNPYPYMKYCDLYVQPSRHEGYGITIDEALCLSKPVVVTDILGIESRVFPGVNGYICECNPESLAEKIQASILNPLTINSLEVFEIDTTFKNYLIK